MLTMCSDERGSAPVEAVFSMVLILVLALGIVEVALALYGRNVVAASAHEGARRAVELGRSAEEASALARSTVERSAGGLVNHMRVAVQTTPADERATVTVRVTGLLDVPGPLPALIPVTATATATTQTSVR